MYLEKAVLAHKNGDLRLAGKYYQNALDHKEFKEALFQNFGAVHRELGNESEAEKLYTEGLRLFPGSTKILLNYANLLRTSKPVKSVAIYMGLLKVSILQDKENIVSSFINIVEMLETLGCYRLAYAYAKYGLRFENAPSLLLSLLRIASKASFSFVPATDIAFMASKAEVYVDSFTALQKSEFLFALAWLYLNNNDLSGARSSLASANEALNGYMQTEASTQSSDFKKACDLRNQYSWNMSCLMLPQQEFREGWTLFEHGLVTPAKGKQKWQRALLKPFTAQEVPLWKGEPLSGRSLLLLEEQAVGDVMQFLTLLPELLKEARHICLLLNPRLVPIYERSFFKYITSSQLSVCPYDSVYDNTLDAQQYDFQSPIGSIFRHRFVDIKLYGNYSPIITPDPNLLQKFRVKYLNYGGETVKKKIIGISWRGGGRPDRIRQKKIDADFLAQ